MSELTEAEMNYVIRRYRYLPVAIRKARAKLEKLEREAIDCGRIDLITDEAAVRFAWESEIALGKLRDREAT